ncbi:alpha/beta-hydrolase [Ceraceosorus guamensis]|uniref:Carboxylic ester hydrolase n=1 Tax=Ceraceosorus guamensis TaxID=1522189 RepID=A0A316VTG2_9BASI|nr:alpha/beta-hydrolase [Ceraceosorus guamensis]PWN40328.1 alpha/beta-hydrolase [Ceraceosorus guamensis]
MLPPTSATQQAVAPMRCAHRVSFGPRPRRYSPARRHTVFHVVILLLTISIGSLLASTLPSTSPGRHRETGQRRVLSDASVTRDRPRMQAGRQDGPLAGVSVQADVNLSTQVDVGKNISGVDVSITAQIGSNSNLVLNTTSGLFSGAYDKDRKQYRWLAIPYAASTAGDNRWKPAQPFVPPKDLLKTPRPATSFGQSCPQFVTRAAQTGLAWSGTVTPSNQGEDCLSISIFTSSEVRRNATRPDYAGSPIFVWLYGGSFLFGSQENKLIDPAPILARHPDVVFITFNYRTNAFGFPQAPQLEEQNLGLHDRDSALDWIRANARSFGGNPDRITLAGQSAGAAAVDSWAFAHSGEDGLPSYKGTGVQSLIIQSGAVSGLGQYVEALGGRAMAKVQPQWSALVAAAGCQSFPNLDDAEMACMRGKSWQDIIAAQHTLGVAFGPINDGKRWFADSAVRSAQGKFAKVPILLGTNDQEGTILCASQSDLANSLYNDVALPFTFVCPATTEASDRIKAGVPAWQYKYGANWDDINSGRKALGAYHQAEIPILFGNFGTTPIAVATGANAGPRQVSVPHAEREVSRFMMDAWMSFVRDPQRGPTTLGWPVFDRRQPTVAHIGLRNSGTVSYTRPIDSEQACLAVGDAERAILRFLKATVGAFV